VAAYHDPEVMKLIPGSEYPLHGFAGVLNRFLEQVPGQTLEGSASQIHHQMLLSAGPAYAELVQTPTRLGQNLARLRDLKGWGDRILQPGEIREGKNRNRVMQWRITK
jgi:hypothetical protein